MSRKIGGTGLGLPIAKQLVDAHKGLIWVESAINKGSKFYFAIPVLSDLEVFKAGLEKQIAVAKSNCYTLGVIKISERMDNSTVFLNDIVSGLINIVRKGVNVKEYIVNENNFKTIYYTVMQMDRFALNFVGKKIDGFVKTEPRYEKCDILFSTVLYPDDEVTVDGLIEKLDNDIIEVKL